MGRSPCCEKAHTNKGAWTKEEDLLLISYIRLHGEGCWRSLPQAAGLMRCGKSCRLRWINYLRPDLKRGNFTLDEDELIIKLHSLLGNKWSLIAARLPGRTDNEIKNYWNTHIKRKLISRGVDPTTHRPFPGSSSSGTRTASPPIPAAEIALAMPSSEEGNCRSGIIEEGGGEEFRVQNQRGTVDLELSIGLSPLQSKPKPPQTMPSQQHLGRGYEFEAGRTQAAVCTCCNLAWADCSNCGGGLQLTG